MPKSYKFTHARNEILYEAKRLLELRATYKDADFPLTRDDVLKATMPPVALECFKRLEAMDAEGVCRTRTVCAAVVPPVVPRITAIEFRFTTTPVYYVWNQQQHPHHAERAVEHFDDPRMNSPFGGLDKMPFDLNALEPEARARFVEWLQCVVRERRICDRALDLIIDFITNHCDSTGELKAKWPGLRVIFHRMKDPWPQRMRDVSPRTRTTWLWQGEGKAWYTANSARMTAVEAVLADCMLADKTTTDPSNLVAGAKPAVTARVLKVARSK